MTSALFFTNHVTTTANEINENENVTSRDLKSLLALVLLAAKNISAQTFQVRFERKDASERR